MNIHQLLAEAELFRYQNGWVGNDAPVIHMPARESRVSLSGTHIETYKMHYGMTQLGYNIPKRWKSSFCTTSRRDSLFFDLFDIDEDGVREVKLPPSTPCGWVKDDFNAEVPFVHPEFLAMVMNIQRWQQTMGGLMKTEPEKYAKINELLKLAKKIETTEMMDDNGYNSFVTLVKGFDELCETLEASKEFVGSNMTKELTKKPV